MQVTCVQSMVKSIFFWEIYLIRREFWKARLKRLHKNKCKKEDINSQIRWTLSHILFEYFAEGLDDSSFYSQMDHFRVKNSTIIAFVLIIGEFNTWGEIPKQDAVLLMHRPAKLPFILSSTELVPLTFSPPSNKVWFIFWMQSITFQSSFIYQILMHHQHEKSVLRPSKIPWWYPDTGVVLLRWPFLIPNHDFGAL